MTKKILLFTMMLAVVLALPFTAFAQDEGQVRLVHAFVGAPDVDIAINGDIVAEGVPYGAASDYLPVPQGDLEISVFGAGEATDLFTQTVTTGADPVTLVVSNADGFIPYADNVDPLNFGETRITAIHAIDDGPTVDVILADGRPVIPSLEFGVPFGTLDLPVIKLPLNVIPSGGDVSSALFAEPITLAPATGTSYMIVVYGTADAPEVMTLATGVNPNPGDGFLQINHAIADGPVVDVYAGENIIAIGIEPETSTANFPVPAGTYEVQVTETDTLDLVAAETITVGEGAETIATVDAGDGGAVINVEGSEAVLVEAPVEPTEAPAEVVEAAPTQAEEVVQPTPAPAQEVVQPPAAPTEAPAAAPPGGGPIARVIIDPGANVQLRQYPDPDALSLGLAPSGAVLNVNGREGAPVQIEGLFSQEVQDAIDSFVDPAEGIEDDQDIDPDNIWFNVTYTTPDGGQITAWALGQFLAIGGADGSAVRIADLPLIPANAFGEATNTEVTPPPTREDTVVAIVFNLNPGVNLKIRRTPTTEGETLELIPAGTVLELLGFGVSGNALPSPETAENANWAYIRYNNPEGGEIIGWVSTQYIQYQWRGESIDFEEMEDRDLLLFEDESTRGEIVSGAASFARPTVDPLRNQFVATVTIDAGANLQFRRNPDAGSESLGLIPSGTQLIVTARNEAGDWLFVEFEGQTGWIATGFVDITFNGEPADLDELPVDSTGA